MKLDAVTRLATALSLLALLAASAAGEAAPAPAAPVQAQLDRLLQQFARTHPGFPGVALDVRTPTLSWHGAAGAAHRSPLPTPRTAVACSDLGYVLLGEILERRTGRGLADAYRTLLDFERLGLARTYLETLEPAPAQARARAHQYLGATDTTQ